MHFRHPSHPGKAVRLGYCMNLHAAETLDELIGGMQRITLPLRERLAPGREFGVGMYLPAQLARELAGDASKLARLKAFLDQHELDPFTFNAFPYGGFQTDGLKERVFEPCWDEPERLAFTLDVARVATQLAHGDGKDRHISISTHGGAHGSHFADSTDRNLKLDRFADAFRRAARALARLESETGRRIVLSIEPEPRSSCNDEGDLSGLHRRIQVSSAASVQPRRGQRATADLLKALDEASPVRRHVGGCLDLCHSAVEFEQAHLAGFGLLAVVGKVQFSSALALIDPATDDAGRQALFALDEPRFLHQVTGLGRDGFCVRVGDIRELVRAWQLGDEAWRSCAEWRCHYHVPVDLDRLGASGLTTTRALADAALSGAIASVGSEQAWRVPELHVEIETYTWDVLPRAARGAGELVDGLEREYRHVLGLLDRAGWRAG